jgi:hypothetical protein
MIRVCGNMVGSIGASQVSVKEIFQPERTLAIQVDIKQFTLMCCVCACLFKLSKLYIYIYGPGSSVGIATGYGLDGPGIKSRWGRDFSQSPDRPWGPPSHPPTMGTGSFPGVKPPVRGAEHPPPPSAEVE